MTDKNAWAIPIIFAFVILVLILPVHNGLVCNVSKNSDESYQVCFREWIAAVGQFAIPIVGIWLSYSIHRDQKSREKLEALKTARDNLKSEALYSLKMLDMFKDDPPGRLQNLVAYGDLEGICSELKVYIASIEMRDLAVSSRLISVRDDVIQSLRETEIILSLVNSAKKSSIHPIFGFSNLTERVKTSMDTINKLKYIILIYHSNIEREQADLERQLRALYLLSN